VSAPQLVHGRIGTYTNHRCRCDNCKAAAREGFAVIRAARKLIRDPWNGWLVCSALEQAAYNRAYPPGPAQ
jgi:hypothetical protein